MCDTIYCMKEIFKIVKDSNPNLRKKCEEVSEITPEIVEFVNDLHEYLVISQNEELANKLKGLDIDGDLLDELYNKLVNEDIVMTLTMEAVSAGAASVEITVGGADIGAPKEIFSSSTLRIL